MKSEYLQKVVAGQIIPKRVARRLDRLSSLKLQTQAVQELPGIIDAAVDEYCNRLEGMGSHALPSAGANRAIVPPSWNHPFSRWAPFAQDCLKQVADAWKQRKWGRLAMFLAGVLFAINWVLPSAFSLIETPFRWAYQHMAGSADRRNGKKP